LRAVRHLLARVFREVRLDRRVGDRRTGRHGDVLLAELALHVASREVVTDEQQDAGDRQHNGRDESSRRQQTVERPAAHDSSLSGSGPGRRVRLVRTYEAWTRATGAEGPPSRSPFRDLPGPSGLLAFAS